MNPLLLGGLGIGGYFLYNQFFGSGSAPKLQSLRRTAPNGKPVQVVVPLTNKPPVIGQSVNVPVKPSNNSGQTYPVVAVKVSTEPSPVVITGNTGAPLAVSTTQDVQKALNTLGIPKPPLAVDGVAGPLTKAAIKSFQSQSGLTADGIAGPQTKTALSNALNDFAATGEQFGSSNEVVQAATQDDVITFAASAPIPVVTLQDIQHALNVLGSSPVLIEDGIQGPATTAAIKAFQITAGLVADGIAGPKTKMALMAALGAVPPMPIAGDFAGMSDTPGKGTHSTIKP